MSTFDKLDDTFNTKEETKVLPVGSETPQDKEPSLPAVLENEEQELESDFQDARALLQKTADYSEEALEGILRIAKDSDQARAYEVAGQLIKSMQENAKDMLEIQEKKKKIAGVGKAKNPVGGTTNNVFVGSTKDLLRAMNKEFNTIDVKPE